MVELKVVYIFFRSYLIYSRVYTVVVHIRQLMSLAQQLQLIRILHEKKKKKRTVLGLLICQFYGQSPFSKQQKGPRLQLKVVFSGSECDSFEYLLLFFSWSSLPLTQSEVGVTGVELTILCTQILIKRLNEFEEAESM